MVERRLISPKRVLPGAGLFAAKYGFDARYMKSPLKVEGCSLKWLHGETEIILQDKSGRQHWELDESAPSYLTLRFLSATLKEMPSVDLGPQKVKRYVLPFKKEFLPPWRFAPVETNAYPLRQIGHVDYGTALEWGYSQENVDQGIETMLKIGTRVRSSMRKLGGITFATPEETERIIEEYHKTLRHQFPKTKYSPLAPKKIKELTDKATRELGEVMDKNDRLMRGGDSTKLLYPMDY